MTGGGERQLSPELKEQLRLEKEAHKTRLAVLADAAFVAGVRQAYEAECAGEAGEPWAKVKRDLGIV
jgi:hypothetical protein